MAKYTIWAVMFAFILAGCAPKQILIVEPTKTVQTKMHLYENGKLTNKFSVNIGRNGIAKKDEKREGDGKTPSGEYCISSLFAYENTKVDMPLIKSEPNIICVDDVKSRFYNQIIDSDTIQKDWDSFEFMRRDDEQYKYGAVIDYNNGSFTGLGSCIFIHIKKNDASPTAGCVALDESDMKTLFFTLNQSKSPTILIAQDEDEFAKFLQKFSLTD